MGIVKKGAVRGMVLYLNWLDRQRSLGGKTSRIARLALNLEKTGSLPAAIGAVFPKMANGDQKKLATILVRGFKGKLQKAAMGPLQGVSGHPSAGITSTGGGSGVRMAPSVSTQHSTPTFTGPKLAGKSGEKTGYWRGGVHYSHKTRKPDRLSKKKKKVKKSAALTALYAAVGVGSDPFDKEAQVPGGGFRPPKALPPRLNLPGPQPTPTSAAPVDFASTLQAQPSPVPGGPASTWLPSPPTTTPSVPGGSPPIAPGPEPEDRGRASPSKSQQHEQLLTGLKPRQAQQSRSGFGNLAPAAQQGVLDIIGPFLQQFRSTGAPTSSPASPVRPPRPQYPVGSMRRWAPDEAAIGQEVTQELDKDPRLVTGRQSPQLVPGATRTTHYSPPAAPPRPPVGTRYGQSVVRPGGPSRKRPEGRQPLVGPSVLQPDYSPEKAKRERIARERAAMERERARRAPRKEELARQRYQRGAHRRQLAMRRRETLHNRKYGSAGARALCAALEIDN